MKKVLYILLTAGLLSACSGDGENLKESEPINPVKTSAKSEAVGQCLADKDYKYEELLTKDDISKYVSIDEPTFKQEISSTKGKYGSCVYTWKSERPETEMDINGTKFKQPDRNQVTIKMLDVYTDRDLKRYKQDGAINLFDQSYKKLSQEEYDQLLANMKKRLGNNEKGFEDAKKMMESRMNFTYEPVENLGDRAYWKWNKNFGIELVVLTGATTFTILNKTTAEAETSLDHAVKFAKEVLAKCGS